MLPRAFSMMSRVTWSMSCSRTKSGASSWMVTLFLLDQDVAVAIYRAPEAGFDNRRGVVLDHDCRARYLVAGAEHVPGVDRSLHPLTLEVHLIAVVHRAGGVRTGPVLALLARDALDLTAPDYPDVGYL